MRLAARAQVTVVTQPDRPAGRGHKPAPTPVKAAALALGLPVRTPDDLRAFAVDVRAEEPARCVVASYGRIVPRVLLEAAPIWLNVHPSQLPLYRGATPIQSALRDGCTTTAVSIIAMDAGMDTGDLMAQTPPLAIGNEETYGSLHDRLAEIGAALLASVFDRDPADDAERVPQDRRARELGLTAGDIARTLTRPWTKADAVLPADATARQLVNRIRALAPKPGAQLPPAAADTGEPLPPIKILRAHVATGAPLDDQGSVAPGTTVELRGHLFVRATDGWIAVDELVPAGRSAMPMAAFANGRRSGLSPRAAAG